LPAVVVSHVNEYGLVVNCGPRFTLSSWNCTGYPTAARNIRLPETAVPHAFTV